jgi:hypothetical protein
VYSASLVLWELLSGRKAIERRALSEAELLEAMAAPSIPALEALRPDLDRRVLDAVRAGLAPNPAERMADAAQMLDALRAATDLESAAERFAGALSSIRSEQMVPGRSAGSPIRRRPPPLPRRARTAAAGAATVAPAPPAVLDATELELEPDAAGSEPTMECIGLRVPAAVAVLPRRGALMWGLALAAAAGFAAIVAASVVRRREPRPNPEPRTFSAAPSVSQEPEAPLPAAQLPDPTTDEWAAPSEPEAAHDRGALRPPASAAGHRIFVDGRTVGEGTSVVELPCGPHTVRIGSLGRTQHVEVPCGETLDLTP